MESLVNSEWNGRRVLVTGHTGFKGSWLTLWLNAMGAKVTGLALPPPTEPSLFEAARIGELIHHIEGDVRDPHAVRDAFDASDPEVVFHLAAQPLVRLSYAEPAATYATNVMGTVHVLEAARHAPAVKAIVCITSDKCYENREWTWPYRECDPMGGHDPYSSSKGCAELAISAWRRSFFGDDGPLLASARAGNVIGGGDWASDRLVPDLVRAFEVGAAPLIRSPHSVRPWQHVLEALRGYIMLAERLLAGEREFADGWNFGPSDEDARKRRMPISTASRPFTKLVYCGSTARRPVRRCAGSPFSGWTRRSIGSPRGIRTSPLAPMRGQSPSRRSSDIRSSTILDR
jgi:CDP-glucose 4,6-dehydratase